LTRKRPDRNAVTALKYLDPVARVYLAHLTSCQGLRRSLDRAHPRQLCLIPRHHL